MSYTGCEFNGKVVHVDGTSYACVIALAIMEASRLSSTSVQRQKWEEELRKLQRDVKEVPTNMIGGDLGDIVNENENYKQDLVKGLYLAEAKLKSFRDGIPGTFLRDAIGQGDKVGYVQLLEYAPAPFIETIRTLLRLMAGGF